MPTGRLTMRRIRDILRLRFAQGLSERAIAASLGLGREMSGPICATPGKPVWLGRFRRAWTTTISSCCCFRPLRPCRTRIVQCRIGPRLIQNFASPG